MRILHGKIDIKRRPEDQTQFVYAFQTIEDLVHNIPMYVSYVQTIVTNAPINVID